MSTVEVDEGFCENFGGSDFVENLFEGEEARPVGVPVLEQLSRFPVQPLLLPRFLELCTGQMYTF